MRPPNSGAVRPAPATYAQFYRSKGVEISPDLVMRQHDGYVRALADAGITVSIIDADPSFYDCVFVEDAAVVWGSSALITSIAAPHRQGEEKAVRAFLQSTHVTSQLPPGAHLEGGDVLHCEDATYVGISARTNTFGAEALRQFMAGFSREVIAVKVDRALHLKTAVTYLGDGALIAAKDRIDLTAFNGLEVIATAPGENGAANCLRIGTHLLIPSGYPATERALRAFAAKHALTVHCLEISEFEKGDGSLSCLSLLWDAGRG